MGEATLPQPVRSEALGTLGCSVLKRVSVGGGGRECANSGWPQALRGQFLFVRPCTASAPSRAVTSLSISRTAPTSLTAAHMTPSPFQRAGGPSSLNIGQSPQTPFPPEHQHFSLLCPHPSRIPYAMRWHNAVVSHPASDLGLVSPRCECSVSASN